MESRGGLGWNDAMQYYHRLRDLSTETHEVR